MDKNVFIEIASGRIEDPAIEVSVEGAKQKFEGKEARIFAFGALFGMRTIEAPETVSVDNNADSVALN